MSPPPKESQRKTLGPSVPVPMWWDSDLQCLTHGARHDHIGTERSRPKQVKDLCGTHRKYDGPLSPRCRYTLCECSIVGPWGPCSTRRGTIAKNCCVQDMHPPANWGSYALSYSVLVWWRLLPTSCLWFRVPNSLTISWSREKRTAKGVAHCYGNQGQSPAPCSSQAHSRCAAFESQVPIHPSTQQMHAHMQTHRHACMRAHTCT